jgi:starvation-inducible outer membrane lipoprotein
MSRLLALLLAAGLLAGCASQPSQIQQCFASAVRDCHAAWSLIEGRNNRTILLEGADRFGYCDARARRGCSRR